MAAKRKLLVLDGQGVVFDAPIRRFLVEFAEFHGIPFAEVEARWENGVRERAWRGLIDDATLWRQLAGHEVDPLSTRRRLDSAYRPGPAASYVSAWSERASIWLLSNHRFEWLVPRLDDFGIRNRFERLLVSDNTGMLKPESAAFEPIIREEKATWDVLFVDDQPHNVFAAEALGIPSVIALSGTEWLEYIAAWLEHRAGTERVPGTLSNGSS